MEPDRSPDRPAPTHSRVFDEHRMTPRLAVSLLSMILVVELLTLNYIEIATALPVIAAHFQTTQGGWLIAAFLVTGAVVSPLFGKLADLYGKRRMLAICLVVTAAGALIAAFAVNYPMLIVGRSLEGFLLACQFLVYSLMRDVYPKRIVPMAVSIAMTGVGVFLVLAPFLVGWLLGSYGFQGIFVLDLVSIVVLGVLIMLSTPETPVRLHSRVDVLGAVLLGAGIVGILVAISQGGTWGWFSAATLGFFLGGVLLLVIWVVTARRTTAPIVDLSTLTRRPVLLAALAGCVAYGTTTMSAQMLPLLGQVPRELGLTYGEGLSPLGYAAITVPSGAMILLGGFVVGKLVQRHGSRRMLMIGLGLLAVSSVFLAFQHDALVKLIIGATVLGLGQGFAYAALPNLVMEASPRQLQGSISSMVQVTQASVSSLMGVVLFAVLAGQIASIADGQPIFAGSGFTTSFLIMAVVLVVGMVLVATVLRRRPEDPAYDIDGTLLAGVVPDPVVGSGTGRTEPVS